MSVLRGAVLYFLCVFGAGFVLGSIRVPLLVPRLGERAAELLELPLMLAVVVLVSRWRQRRTATWRPARQLAAGALAWLFLMGAEFALAAALTGRSPREVVLAHDPVAGTAYYAATILFALGPWFWARRAVRLGAGAGTGECAAGASPEPRPPAPRA